MMEYGEKVTADPSTFDDPQYMFLRERLRALQDGWAEVHQMWENRQSLLSQSLSLQMFNRYRIYKPPFWCFVPFPV
jgi:spectrin beta